MVEFAAPVAALAALIAVALLLRAGQEIQRLRILAEQGLAGQRGEAEATRLAVTRSASEAAERMAVLRGALETGVE